MPYLINWVRNSRCAGALALAVLAAACATVSPYDEVIDKGIVDFAEQLNTFVKNMADAAGKPEGTYDANTKTYNALDSKLDVLIARASAASDGKACKIEAKFYDRISRLLGDQIPAELKGASGSASGDANSCNAVLLEKVKQQLSDIREIHKTTDKCRSASGEISCLRPATAGTALKIANQSINAVSVVEAAKKNL
jgi:hypothetical protein